jgi:hypothetical protein
MDFALRRNVRVRVLWGIRLPGEVRVGSGV